MPTDTILIFFKIWNPGGQRPNPSNYINLAKVTMLRIQVNRVVFGWIFMNKVRLGFVGT